MNTVKVTSNTIAADVTQCRPPLKIGCVAPTIPPGVTQCRPPSKVGCVITGAPVLQGEAVKPVATQSVREVPACGEIYTLDTAAPDISLAFTIIVASIFGNCR